MALNRNLRIQIGQQTPGLYFRANSIPDVEDLFSLDSFKLSLDVNKSLTTYLALILAVYT